MLGRGGESTYHCGNIAFRQLVEDHKSQYYAPPRSSKSRVVSEVVKKWRNMNPPGRFLTRAQPGSGEESSWHDVGDRRALKKASHSLRDSVRCISIEKKQREEDEKHQGHPISDEDESEESRSCSKIPNRKRGRAANATLLPEFLVSSGSRHEQKSAVLMVHPSKKRRLACDEREDVLDDCRLDRGLLGVGDSREEVGRQAKDSYGDIPSSISWNNALSGDRLESNPSPCGSADWFAPLGGMPVQQPSQALPIASMLIGEFAVANQDGGLSEDDDNFGLFGDERAVLSFLTNSGTAPGGFSLHRPMAVPSKSASRSSGNPSETREL